MSEYTTGEAINLLERDNSLVFTAIIACANYRLFIDRGVIEILSEEGLSYGDPEDVCLLGIKWALHDRNVTIQEAMKAYTKGNSIYCEVYDFKLDNMVRIIYDKNHSIANNITPEQIADGQWYISNKFNKDEYEIVYEYNFKSGDEAKYSSVYINAINEDEARSIFKMDYGDYKIMSCKLNK